MSCMKTILCESGQKGRIYHDLAGSQNTSAIADVQLLSLSALLKADETEDLLAIPLRLSHLLLQSAEKFPIYRDMFVYPAFIGEILSFARECVLYQIDCDTLQETTAGEAELKQILKIAFSLPLSEKEIVKQYEAALRKVLSLKDLEIRIRFEADPFKADFLESIIKNHPHVNLSIPKKTPSVREVRYARSTRLEIEAIAQDICRRSSPCTVVLCSYGKMMPVLKQVFARYGIPFCSLPESTPSALVRAYTALAYFALQKDGRSFIRALEANAFPVPCHEPLLSWLRQTLKGTSFTPIENMIASDLFENERKYVHQMDTAAADYFRAIQSSLDLLRSDVTPSQALQNAWEVLRKSPIANDPQEIRAARSVMALLNQTLNEIHSETDAVFVLRQVESVLVTHEQQQSYFCTVTDLSHPSDLCETVYVAGCSAQNYPGIPVRKGLFDEAYVSHIAGYPSLEKRHSLWNRQLCWLEELSERVIYSYSVSDYQGKEIQPAFEITSRYNTGMPWTIDQLAPVFPSPHTLDADTAKALCTDEDGKIHSSISRIERYFYCPYSWFIQSALKIRRPMHAALDAATTGNLQHALMEHAVDSLGKNYTSLGEEEIRSYLAPAFVTLRSLYPAETAQIDLSEERMISGILDTMRFLSGSEAAAPVWIPSDAEKAFNENLTEHLQLNGIIDRIDESPDSIRVMDYKSSHKTLSEKKIRAGIQLQLPSYIIIAAMLKQKKPAGVYYISMKPDATAVKAGSFKTNNKGGVPMEDFSNEETLRDAEKKTRRIAGWALDDPEINDDLYKEYFNPGSGQFDYEQIKACILDLYEKFYHNAADGKIDVDPIEGACTFCEYKPVCRFHDTPRSVIPVVTEGESFKKGKEADN